MKIKYPVFLLCFLVSISGNSQTLFPDPGKVFNDELLPKVYIEIDPADFATILDPSNIGDTTHYPVTFVFDNLSSRDTFEDVGFRLRGNTSQNAAKKSFKISFNTFVSGRKYKGLEKLNINGEHNDPSVVRSKLYWDLARQSGIPAPRSNHVELFINDNYWGLYINVEHIDEEYAQLRYGNQLGNLYKCLWPATLEYLGSNSNLYKIESGGRRIYDLKTNTAADDYSDIAEFIDVLNNTSNSDLPCELEKVFDVQNYLKVIALDILTANWDGPIFNKNNFYLYSNPQTGKIQYIPYDVDNTFGIQWFGEWTDRNIYSWAPSNEPRPIYTKIINNSHYRAQFTYYMEEYLDLYFNENGFFDDINNRKALIEGSIPNDPLYSEDYGFTNSDFDNSYVEGLSVFHVPLGLKEYISLRIASALNQLENTNAAPIITNLQSQGGSGAQDISIRVKIEDEGIPNAVVEYSFNSQNGQSTLFDDGLHNDGAANDGTYGAIIPAFNASGTLTYYIDATDTEMNNNRFPYCQEMELTIFENNTALYINEFMADNTTIVADEFGEYDDWIELYNAGTTALDLSNFFLSDDSSEPLKWQLPEEMIQPGEFLLIWADNDVNQGAFHANFKLSADGEVIILSNSAGNTIDYISFGAQNTDAAFGRFPNGTGAFQGLAPTPGASNMAPTSVEENWSTEINIFPNPVTDLFYISGNQPIKEVQVYTILGQAILLKKVDGLVTQVDMSGNVAGVYVANVVMGNGEVLTSTFNVY